MTAPTDLRTHYLSYIATINAAYGTNSIDLSPFVHQNLTHNSNTMPITDLQAFLISSQKDLPGFKLEPDVLVVENEDAKGNGQVAARIKFSYWPDGKEGEVRQFFEHCFYRFREGKWEKAWATFDEEGKRWAESRKGRVEQRK